MTDAGDEDLMARYQQGDAMAFASLVARYEARLWNFLRRFVGDPTAAEDLLQDVFMRVVKNAATWQPAAKFSTWIFTIARNLCTDHARRGTHRKALSLDNATGPGPRGADDGSGPRLLDKVAGRDPGGERWLAHRELVDRLDLALAALPDEQREVFLMREVTGLSFADIAVAVGASEPTVKSRMRYALEKLREALADFRDVGTPPALVAMTGAKP